MALSVVCSYFGARCTAFKILYIIFTKLRVEEDRYVKS